MTRRNASRLIVLALFVGLALPIAGCLVSARSSTEVTGNPVSETTLSQIEPGAKHDFVLALLGEPTSKSQLEDGSSLWKWAYREQKTSRGGIFLILSSTRTSEKTGTVFVHFEDETVKRSWRDEG